MPTLPDLLLAGFVAIVLPVWDYLVLWPRLEREFAADPPRARRRLWTAGLIYPWALVLVLAALWVGTERPWSALRLQAPIGWRLWAATACFLLLLLYYLQAAAAVARDERARASVRGQFTGQLGNVLPHTRSDLRWFGAVAVTAGFCEELLYRGFLIWVLAPWLGWWGAATVALALFAAGHAYQGWSGVVRTGLVGAVFTGLVALFDSLWPAMVLHALVDLASGVLAWLALRAPAPAAA
jgi:membrane protease YdiL (CAAX protease family)